MAHSHWLIKQGHKDLIIFWGGAGVLPDFFTLPSQNHDVVMIYDYTTPQTSKNFRREIQAYKTVKFISWSMGVFFSHLVSIVPKYHVAINGTLNPISSQYGIPPRIFDHVLSALKKGNQAVFFRSILGNKKLLTEFETAIKNSSAEKQFLELNSIKNQTKRALEKSSVNKVILSTRDLVFPFEAMKRFWDKEANVKITEMKHLGHFIFKEFCSWEEILQYE